MRRKAIALLTAAILILAALPGSVMAAPSSAPAEDQEQHLYAIYNRTTKAVTFSLTEPQPADELDVKEITESYTINSFMRASGHGDIKTVDFALEDENGNPVKIVFAPRDCNYLFHQKGSLTHIYNLSNVDTSKCTTMSMMFTGCENLEEADVSKFDTSKVTDMQQMFSLCRKLKVIDVSNFDTSKVGAMQMMFQSCNAVEVLDVSGFDTSSIDSNLSYSDGYMAMFNGCRKVKELDLSTFDMSKVEVASGLMAFLAVTSSLEKLTLGTKTALKKNQTYDSKLNGSWIREGDTRVYTGEDLMNSYDGRTMSGTYIRSALEGHFYRTDGSLDAENLWEVHSPESPFKGYCINLNKKGVGTYLDRVAANDDSVIIELLCTAEEGSTHGSYPLGNTMREALITLIYYGWPNDGAGIQAKYGLTNNEYMNLTQVAIWDFTDKYENKAGEYKFTGNMLLAYKELLQQRYANIPGNYTLYLYGTWDKNEQNLISIHGLTDQVYGGVQVQKLGNDRRPLSGAEFTIYDLDGNEVEKMVSRSDGVASICRTDSYMGLPAGTYKVKETKAPAGYELSDTVYTFTISKDNEIVLVGTEEGKTTEDVMVFYDDEDEDYKGGGVIVTKRSEKGKMLTGAEFTIYNSEGEEVMTIRTDGSGVARTGIKDLPLGDYTIKETKAPAGYIESQETKQFTLTENGKYYATDIEFVNGEKTGEYRFEVKKVLENGNLKKDQFEFELLDDSGRVIDKAKNDADGKVRFSKINVDASDLGFKNYTIREIDEDKDNIQYDRHVLPVSVLIVDKGDENLECNVIYGSEGTTFTNIADRVKYKVSFSKTILNKEVILEGAQLSIVDKYGRSVKEWTTGPDPVEAELYPGEYRLVEIKAPGGYDQANAIPFTIGEDGKVTCDVEGALSGNTITMKDSHHNGVSFSLKKLDGESSEALKGAVFTLKGTDELGQSVFATARSDESGMLCFSGLMAGEYTLEETQPPVGYEKTDKKWNVKVDLINKISRTPNIDAYGEASGDYGNDQNLTDTVVMDGADGFHVRIYYKTEAGWDYVYLKDQSGNKIKTDKNGKNVGDSGWKITGGRSDDIMLQQDYDFDGDTILFNFVSDDRVVSYGYYAEITYSKVTITDEEGSTMSPVDGMYVFDNTKKIVDIPVSKKWEGDESDIVSRPSAIQVKLLANGTETGDTLTLSEENEWKGTFIGLPAAIGGDEANYTVREVKVDGYDTSVKGDADSGFVITNKKETPEEPKTPEEPGETDEKPTIIKLVNEGKVSRLKHVTDPFVFKIKATAPKGIKSYSIVDDIPDELEPADKNKVNITVNGKNLSEKEISQILTIKGQKMQITPTLEQLSEWGGFEMVIEFKSRFKQPVSDKVKKEGVINTAVATVDGEEYFTNGDSEARVYPLSAPEKNSIMKTNKKSKMPTKRKASATGDYTDLGWLMILSAVSLATALIVGRRRILKK